MESLGKKLAVLSISAMALIFLAGAGLAQHGHGGKQGGSSPKSGQEGHSAAMKNRPVQSVTVEGLKISLDVMTMEEHMKMGKDHGGHPGGAANGKSHHFAVKVQDTASNEIISDAKVGFTVQTPAGEKQTGKLNWSGDHYGGDVDLKGNGVFQVRFSIESGGMERQAEFTLKS
jgi:hypothetical protein